MNNNQPDNPSQEIDLSILQKSIVSFFGGIEKAIYSSLRFFLRNAILLAILMGLGLAIGYYLDSKKNKNYKHEVIVIPNIENKSYVYTAVRNFGFLPNDGPILKVEIEPIVDVNLYISRGENLKRAEYLSENNIQIDKHKEGNQTELIYKYHLITIYTNQPDTDGKIISSYLESLGNDKFLKETQRIDAENIVYQIKEYEESIDDINKIFKKLGSMSTTTSSDINIGIETQSEDLITVKKRLVDDINFLKKRQLEELEVINEVSRFSNIQHKTYFFAFAVPFLLIGGFLVIVWLRRVHKKYQLN